MHDDITAGRRGRARPRIFLQGLARGSASPKWSTVSQSGTRRAGTTDGARLGVPSPGGGDPTRRRLLRLDVRAAWGTICCAVMPGRVGARRERDRLAATVLERARRRRRSSVLSWLVGQWLHTGPLLRTTTLRALVTAAVPAMKDSPAAHKDASAQGAVRGSARSARARAAARGVAAASVDAAARATASARRRPPSSRREALSTVADELAPGPGAYSHVDSFDRGREREVTSRRTACTPPPRSPRSCRPFAPSERA